MKQILETERLLKHYQNFICADFYFRNFAPPEAEGRMV